MKHTEVLERVYDPRRLWAAWQQVKQNAGAAGNYLCMISRERLSDRCPVADRRAAYLVGTSRSVGRG